MFKNSFPRIVAASLFALLFPTSQALAMGIQPETSVVLVHENTGEGTIGIKNTGDEPVLLVSIIENIQEDQDDWVTVSPPAAVLAPGKTQLVRFLLTSDKPLDTQRMKRAVFEGIPQSGEQGNKLRLTIRQDLPLIALPKGVPNDNAPWRKLQWEVRDGTLTVHNPSPYIVRMDQQVHAQPSNQALTLPKTYVLPGETLQLATTGAPLQGQSTVRLYPASVYGYQVSSFDAPIKH
ncbi:MULTISPECIES: fimbria/pilus chaperone family protein [Achromobacter]|uniref:Fimbria/pilus chaperone family protein n=1 Tax=Achromobacter spanius TaxID=217203 RepID=A0ABY8GRE1_9BURK|nr:MULTISPECIES: fimbria/pilus chaperone family protein [Achromobacter]WAI83569.1 fimbria/pilus chaperone family protein [Achromobacter spanius]WEX93653.1 fimbria/pilus chaperone family protein [Achromobacter sp. SS2-2022]WFP07186.1 fimbria/pilus chaperone family protein [Achromobacter spanius]